MQKHKSGGTNVYNYQPIVFKTFLLSKVRDNRGIITDNCPLIETGSKCIISQIKDRN